MSTLAWPDLPAAQQPVWPDDAALQAVLAELRSPAFGEAFLAKGRLSPVLETLPIQAVTDAAIGSFLRIVRLVVGQTIEQRRLQAFLHGLMLTH